MSEAEFAREMSELGHRVSESMVSSWTRGEREPSGQHVGRVVIALHRRSVNAIRLFDGLVAQEAPKIERKAAQAERSIGAAGAVDRSAAQPARSAGDSLVSGRNQLTPSDDPAASKGRGVPLAAKTPPSAKQIADEAAELVHRLALQLYKNNGPQALRDWLIRLAVETPPDQVPEIDDLVRLAREARWRWKEDDATGEAGRAGPDPPE